MSDADQHRARLRRRLTTLAVASLLLGACSAGADEQVAVTEREAVAALETLAEIAAERSPAAMQRICELSADECAGMSGSIRHDQRAATSAPGPDDPPEVLCGQRTEDGAWMLVVEGIDGWSRPYVSQLVLERRDGVVVPTREPAFWFGVAYTGPANRGSTSWTTAYGADDNTDVEHSQMVLDRARSACT